MVVSLGVRQGKRMKPISQSKGRIHSPWRGIWANEFAPTVIHAIAWVSGIQAGDVDDEDILAAAPIGGLAHYWRLLA
ncbi:hypothetical protein NGA35_05745 [Pseudomonas stutzeri]|nr:hypothetical protein [Stutzerimonas stutzeri]